MKTTFIELSILNSLNLEKPFALLVRRDLISALQGAGEETIVRLSNGEQYVVLEPPSIIAEIIAQADLVDSAAVNKPMAEDFRSVAALLTAASVHTIEQRQQAKRIIHRWFPDLSAS